VQRVLSVKACVALGVLTGALGLALIRLLPPPPPDPGLKDRLETFRESNAFLGKQ
jgi:hypothetical protein